MRVASYEDIYPKNWLGNLDKEKKYRKIVEKIVRWPIISGDQVKTLNYTKGNPKFFQDTLECHDFNSYIKLFIGKLDAGGPLPGDPDEPHPVTEP